VPEKKTKNQGTLQLWNPYRAPVNKQYNFIPINGTDVLQVGR